MCLYRDYSRGCEATAAHSIEISRAEEAKQSRLHERVRMLCRSADELVTRAFCIMEKELAKGEGLKLYYLAADVRRLCQACRLFPELMSEARENLERLEEQAYGAGAASAVLALRVAKALDGLPPHVSIKSS